MVHLQDMAWCQGYAFQNRKHMLDLMVDSVNEVTGANPNLKDSVNIHHNYCQCERCQYTVSLAPFHICWTFMPILKLLCKHTISVML